MNNIIIVIKTNLYVYLRILLVVSSWDLYRWIHSSNNKQKLLHITTIIMTKKYHILWMNEENGNENERAIIRLFLIF